jgi:hypothetical protein
VTENRIKPAAAARRRQQPKRGFPRLMWFGLGGLILVLVGIAFLARPNSHVASVAPQVDGQPKLAVDRDKVDFGTVALNKPVEATFKLTNIGDKPLQIEDQPTIQVQQGC